MQWPILSSARGGSGLHDRVNVRTGKFPIGSPRAESAARREPVIARGKSDKTDLDVSARKEIAGGIYARIAANQNVTGDRMARRIEGQGNVPLSLVRPEDTILVRGRYVVAKPERALRRRAIHHDDAANPADRIVLDRDVPEPGE